MAAISALEALKKPCAVDLFTDSQYVRQGITGWIHGWKRNGWRTADKKPVKNVDLWQRLDAALKPHEVRWHWVKGHAGHDENERADQLARDGVAMARLKRLSTRPVASSFETRAGALLSDEVCFLDIEVLLDPHGEERGQRRASRTARPLEAQ